MRIAIVVAGVLLLSGCAPHTASNSADDSDKYTQTWATSYSETTCSDWVNKMTEHQKFVAAADILTSARDKIDGGTGVAPDDLIRRFESDITTGCVEPTVTLTDASYVIYNSDSSYKP